MARVRNLNHAAKANKKATKTATEKAVKQSVIPVMSTKQSRKQPVGTYVEQTDTTPVEESPELSVDDLVIQPANSHVKLATKLCLAAAVSGQFKFAKPDAFVCPPVPANLDGNDELTAKFERLSLLQYHLNHTWVFIKYYKIGIKASKFDDQTTRYRTNQLMNKAMHYWNGLNLVGPAGRTMATCSNYNVLKDNVSRYRNHMRALVGTGAESESE